MKMMGHKNLGTSLRYIHLRDAGTRDTCTKATAAIAAALARASERTATEPDGSGSQADQTSTDEWLSRPPCGCEILLAGRYMVARSLIL